MIMSRGVRPPMRVQVQFSNLKYFKIWHWPIKVLITGDKLVEYLVNIHLMLFLKNHVINVHLMVLKHGIFLCVQFVCCAFGNSTWKVRMWATLYKENTRSGGVLKLFFVQILFSDSVLGLILRVTTWKK